MSFENLEKEQPSIGCSFLLYRKLVVSYKAKNAPRGCASRGEEVSCKQHCSSAKESQATLCSLIGNCCLAILIFS